MKIIAVKYLNAFLIPIFLFLSIGCAELQPVKVEYSHYKVEVIRNTYSRMIFSGNPIDLDFGQFQRVIDNWTDYEDVEGLVREMTIAGGIKISRWDGLRNAYIDHDGTVYKWTPEIKKKFFDLFGESEKLSKIHSIDWERKLKLGNEMEDIAPGAPSYFTKAFALLHLGKFRESIEYYLKATKYRPWSAGSYELSLADIFYYSAVEYLYKNDYKQGLHYLCFADEFYQSSLKKIKIMAKTHKEFEKCIISGDKMYHGGPNKIGRKIFINDLKVYARKKI